MPLNQNVDNYQPKISHESLPA